MLCRVCGLEGEAYAGAPGICKACKRAYSRARQGTRVRGSQAGLNKKPAAMHRAFKALGEYLGARRRVG